MEQHFEKTSSESLLIRFTKVISMIYPPSDEHYIENQNGILCIYNVRICTFAFRIEKIEVFKNRLNPDVPTERIILDVQSFIPGSSNLSEDCLNKPERFVLPGSVKDNIKNISRILGVKYIIHNMKAFRELFLSMLQFAKIEEVYHIYKIGWQDNSTYAFSNGVIDEAETEDATSRKINIDNKIKDYSLRVDPASVIESEGATAAAKLVTEHLFRLTKSPLSKFLYLYLVLSFMTTQLLDRHRNEAPMFTPMIVAKPLTGKTYLCETLLYYMKNNPKINLSTGTTYNGFLKIAKHTKDCLFLVDDHKLDPVNGKKSEDIINRILRMEGDNAGRSNAFDSQELECMVLLAGEILPSVSFSSISRMLIWNLKKEDIDRNEENFVRKNAELYATHILSLLRWIKENNADFLTDELLESYHEEKELLLDKDHRFNERVAASYAWLLSVYKVIALNYFNDIGMDYISEYDKLEAFAMRELKQFKNDHLAEDPLYIFCKALQHSKDRMMVDSQNSTVKDSCIGTYDQCFYYIREHKLETLIDQSMCVDKKVLEELLSDSKMLNAEKPRYKYLRRHRINRQEEKVYQINSALVDEYVDNIDRQINATI